VCVCARARQSIVSDVHDGPNRTTIFGYGGPNLRRQSNDRAGCGGRSPPASYSTDVYITLGRIASVFRFLFARTIRRPYTNTSQSANSLDSVNFLGVTIYTSCTIYIYIPRCAIIRGRRIYHVGGTERRGILPSVRSEYFLGRSNGLEENRFTYRRHSKTRMKRRRSAYFPRSSVRFSNARACWTIQRTCRGRAVTFNSDAATDFRY